MVHYSLNAGIFLFLVVHKTNVLFTIKVILDSKSYSMPLCVCAPVTVFKALSKTGH